MNSFGICVFLSNGLYGQRSALHFDCYRAQAGHYFLEVGNRTLEVELTAPHMPSLRRLTRRAVGALGVGIAGVAAASPTFNPFFFF